MIKYALMDYVPQKYLRKAKFETLMDDSFIWNFKDGKAWAVKKAAKMVAEALSTYNMENVVFMCVPAACQRTYVRRCQKFSEKVCERTGATDGFPFINVIGRRAKLHNSRQYVVAVAEEIEQVYIDENAVKGKVIILFDDVITTGKTCDTFKERLESLGATVKLAVFLGKTKNYRKRFLS
jgi:predicted amidophosphoribosyltransferase